MTRDEAAQRYMLAKQMGNHPPHSTQFLDTLRLIDAFSALGMLKLDEPKSVEGKFRDAFYELVDDKYMLSAVHMALGRAGLKIVEK